MAKILFMREIRFGCLACQAYITAPFTVDGIYSLAIQVAGRSS